MAWHPVRNLPLKVFATILAILLWMSVSGDLVVERNLRVPLELRNVARDLEILGDSPPAVDVRVRGASSVLGRLADGDVVAVLDLREARPGERMFHLRTNEVRRPFGVEVIQISPPTVPLSLERSASRMVPVVPVVQGEPAAGFIAGQVTVAPEVVEVVGPASRIEALRGATTEAVTVDNATAPVRDTVTVGLTDSTLRLRDVSSAIVTVNVLPAPLERVVRDVPVGARNLPEGLRMVVEPERVTVVLRGRREALGSLEVSALEAWVDVASLGEGRYTLPVNLDPGPNFGVAGVDPEWVQLRLLR